VAGVSNFAQFGLAKDARGKSEDPGKKLAKYRDFGRNVGSVTF
jgi:hypothetical protein